MIINKSIELLLAGSGGFSDHFLPLAFKSSPGNPLILSPPVLPDADAQTFPAQVKPDGQQ